MKRDPFTTDGCSGGMSWSWRKLTGADLPWRACCVNHDREYWLGGTKGDRLKADRRMRRCVKSKGHPRWASLMFWGVRAFGSPRFPTPHRWGCGDGKMTGEYCPRCDT